MKTLCKNITTLYLITSCIFFLSNNIAFAVSTSIPQNCPHANTAYVLRCFYKGMYEEAPKIIFINIPISRINSSTCHIPNMLPNTTLLPGITMLSLSSVQLISNTIVTCDGAPLTLLEPTQTIKVTCYPTANTCHYQINH